MNVLVPQRGIAVIVCLSSQHQITAVNEGNFTNRQKCHFCYGNFTYSSCMMKFHLKEEFINGNYSFVVFWLLKGD